MGLLQPTAGRDHCATASRGARSSSSARRCCGAAPPRTSATPRPARDRTRELLALVGLEHAAERPARRLSAGEQQRLALARALARDPDDPVPRRADREPRPRLDQGDRGRDPHRQRARHQGRDVDPRSRRGATAGGRGRSVASWPDRRSRRRTRASSTRRAPTRRASSSLGSCSYDHADARCIGLLAALSASPCRRCAQENSIVVASTTSTQDSGLFGYLLPLFKARTGIDVKVVALGTGQALDTARRGDADVVFVHARSEEEKFVAEGFGVKRYPVMYNDFVLIGPRSDPAGVGQVQGHRRGAADASRTRSCPSSRAATARARTSPSSSCGRRPASTSQHDKGTWYKSIGQGMGAALNTASASDAYVLADRGTWLSFKNKGDLAIVVQGDKRLFNQYGVMLVNPAKHPHVKKEPASSSSTGWSRREGQGDDRRLQDQRRAAVLPERRRPERVSVSVLFLGALRSARCSARGRLS